MSNRVVADVLGGILAALTLAGIILAWVAVKIYAQTQRRRTRWRKPEE